MNYHVIRSRRRTVSIEVTRDGRVTVRAPLRITPREIDLFIRSRSEWISRKLQCAAELNAERKPAFTESYFFSAIFLSAKQRDRKSVV